MIQNLRTLELAAGIALLSSPDKAKKLLEPLGLKIPTARSISGLRELIN